jgi:glyoxylase-like metal-dependent hydrolase (beta-lactamase superfamily II)
MFAAVAAALTVLAQGVFAWLADPPAHGRANAGVVIDADGVTVIDTLMVPSQWEPFAEAVEALGRPIRRVVLSSSHIPFVGGSARFRQAAVYGTSYTSDLLDLPANVAGYRLLHPSFAGELDDELVTRPVTHIVDVAAELTPALHLFPLDGPSPGNLVAVAPGAGVCFGGALCSFASTPLGFEADFEAWAAALDTVAGFGPCIVPGIGPVGGPEEVNTLQAYLRACLAAQGDVGRLAPGPWDGWSGAEFHAVNVERAALAAAGEERIPDAMLRLIGL